MTSIKFSHKVSEDFDFHAENLNKCLHDFIQHFYVCVLLCLQKYNCVS